MYTRVYTPGYTSLYHPGYIHQGIPTYSIPPWVHPAHTVVYTAALVLHGTDAVYGAEALGSNPGITMGGRRERLPFLLRCVERAKPLRRVVPLL